VRDQWLGIYRELESEKELRSDDPEDSESVLDASVDTVSKMRSTRVER
jgi:hypothetical protein